MMNYTGWEIPEGKVVKVEDADGNLIWQLPSGGKVVLQVEKITSDTYAGETTYTGEEFILLDIYPKTNGTVKVTYGGLTKTITDTSGAEEPNAQQVYFGTFNGVSDEVETPANGELTIEGDCVAFGCSNYKKTSKDMVEEYCCCIKAIDSFGKVEFIPDYALGSILRYGTLTDTEIVIPSGVVSIGEEAFACCGLTSVVIGKDVKFVGYQAFIDTIINAYTLKTAEILATTPPEVGTYDSGTEVKQVVFANESTVFEKLVVPKGCGEAYKAAAGWSQYADYIVEAS